ncbi:MAG: ABC transporter permease [Syntrophorhabdus aromaticivorans]|uniref:Transport permease protein n=1 Tax=Syntrophorhabdus aromaticivorans TaxID=328301 RepID=A0A971S1N4_9BACT|nr:ABC transporter permease [Syntrophorhabdus aromaticivorans]
MNPKTRHYVDIILVLIQKDLKVRYKNTFFGYLWSVGHPLAFAVVFYIAFKVVVRIQVDDYVLFLISGLFPWQWFNNSLNTAPMIFLANASIIKKISFPRELLPITLVLQDMLHFLFSIPVIILFIYIYGKTPSFLWLYGIPMLLLIQFLMMCGICLIVASTNLFFRDLERLTAIATTLLFYFTPIFYPERMVPDKFQHLLVLNPLAHLMINWRNMFLTGKIDPLFLGISFAYSVGIFLAGYMLFRKLSWRFAEVL